MTPALEGFLHTHHFAITTAEAASIGISREVLRLLVARKVLTRVGRGAYVQTSALDREAHDAGRHVLRVHALVRSRPEDWAASHLSAALLWGLPVPQVPLDRLHVCHARPVGTSRRRSDYSVHLCPGEQRITRLEGLPVVAATTAVVGTALQVPHGPAVAAMDAALHRGLVSPADLLEQLDTRAHVPGILGARLAVARADGRSESPGESLLRLILLDLGLTVIPQHVVRDGDVVVARVDFYLPELGVVLEFDGRLKYAGHEGRQALAAEKHREDRIRALGYGVGRLTWDCLTQPAVVSGVVARAARSASPHLIAARAS
ncbi:type IV toxin-antitoxin system AbiEi family antitoxin domain-containing protein [uncultured Serinicoccus sp.]|uniref:type IV toxin-antitoxin system AbiEi family antitoxin domain-containing protein n=1 Tax=uncultured Serinicoccus sp. TaxID=735514 RepID=UPI00262B5965|nr:type IV toxin-antitoxin system AbiEi family antitoxin domain-containing protein [uncultured Serinicoccus sp.]